MLGALALLPSSGPANTSFTPPSRLDLAFDASFTPAERAAVEQVVASARPQARALIVAVSGQIRVARSADGGCPDRTSSCVRASSRLAGGKPASRGIVLELGAPHLAQAATPLGRFVILHELGHAVDAAMLDQHARDDLEDAFARAGWHPACARPGDPVACPAAHEVFADEFARWAGGFGVSLSAYRTPALVDDRTMGALLARWAHPQPLADLFGAWPG